MTSLKKWNVGWLDGKSLVYLRVVVCQINIVQEYTFQLPAYYLSLFPILVGSLRNFKEISLGWDWG
jgi:hypothetical protein